MTFLKNLCKISLLLWLFMWVSFWNNPWFPWFNLSFSDFSDSLSDKFSEIHFWYNWTDYWGLLFVTEFKDVNETLTIDSTSHSVVCNKKLKGYYRNPIRWSMVFPLSQEDLTYWQSTPHNSYDDISLNWSFFSDCVWYPNSIIWQIDYKYKWNKLFSIVVWRNSNSRWLVDGSKWFANTFQLYQWVTPIWLLFDSNLGLWMVWAHIVTWSNLSYVTWATSYTEWFNTVVDWINQWNWVNQFVSSIKDWIVDFKNWSTDIKWRRWDVTAFIASSVVWVVGWYNLWLWAITTGANYVSNLQKMWSMTDNWWWYDQKAYYIWASQNELSKRLNNLRKNSAEICKWKWNVLNTSTTIVIGNSDWDIKEGEINCVDASNTTQVSKILIDRDLTLNWKITTIVTKWWNINLIMAENQLNSWYLNVFIDWWVMSIKDTPWTWNLAYLDWNWDYSSTTNVAMWFILKWNYDINWIMWWWKSSSFNTPTETTFWDFSHKLYIQWSLSSLHTVEDPKFERVSLVEELIWSLFNWSTSYQNLINLKNTFKWRCEDTAWLWTDGAPCSVMASDKWSHNSLIVMNKNLSNMLMK